LNRLCSTEIFIKYLIDSAKEESELLADRIVNGGIVEVDEQIRISTECLTLMRISDISIEEIDEFYQDRRNRNDRSVNKQSDYTA